MSDESILRYSLPLTWVRIAGTTTTKRNLTSDKLDASSESTVSLIVAPDPNAAYEIDFEKSKLADRAVSIELSPAGLLTSTTSTSTGQLGKVIGSVVSAVASVAAVAGGLLGGPAAGGFATMMAAEEPDEDRRRELADPESGVDEPYATEHPERARRRAELRERIPALRERIRDQRERICEAADDTERKRIAACVEALGQSLAELIEEARELDAHLEAWRSVKEAPVTRSYTFLLRVTELPRLDDVKGVDPDQAPLGAMKEVYDALHVVVARSDGSTAGGGASPPAPRTRARGVFHRQPRPVRLTILKPLADRSVSSESVSGAGSVDAADSRPAPRSTLRPVSASIEAVLDGHSPLGFVEFGKSAWSKRAAEMTFGDTGSLTKLSNEKASELAAAAEAVESAPEKALAGLESANKILDQLQTVSLQGVTHRIAVLQQEKAVLEATVARDDLLATRDATSELKAVQAELALLQDQRQLGTARRALDADAETEMVRLRTDVLKVRTELERSQVERLKAQAELAELGKP